MSATAFQRRRRELAAEAAEAIEVEKAEVETEAAEAAEAIEVEKAEVETEAAEAAETEEATEEKPKKGRRKGGEA